MKRIQVFVVGSPGDMIKMFDMDMADRMLYYVSADNTIYSRPIDLPMTDDATELIVEAAGDITGTISLGLNIQHIQSLFWTKRRKLLL